MTGGKRTLAGGGVVLMGLIAAAPFYRSQPLAPPTPPPTDDVVWHHDAEGSSPAGDIARQPQPAVPEVASAAHRQVDLAVESPAAMIPPKPQAMAPTYQELVRSVPRVSSKQAISAPSANAPTAEVTTRKPQVSPAQTTPTQPKAPRRTRLRLHRVKDGDTLQRLAERYLGSAAKWREVFETNRDRLSHPQLLPIGAELRIRIPLED